tara:strand:- start:915 stop:1352 length:438 start_codon:yes stop_codon:yes gene_type:complete
MARYQHLGRDQEDPCEGGPSLNLCSGHVAISPIYHISEACCLTGMKYQKPIVVGKDSWKARDFAARSSTLPKLASLCNCSFAKANYLKSGCQLSLVALDEEVAMKRGTVAHKSPPFVDCLGTPRSHILVRIVVYFWVVAWGIIPL